MLKVPKLLRLYAITLLYVTIIAIIFAIIRIIPQPIIAIIKKCFLIIALIAKQKWRFGMEFIAEIGGAALLGGISATIGNQCSTIRSRRSRKGSLLGGGRVDASMAACMGQK